MKVATLQENLRQALLVRIRNGELTGLSLALKAGFQQAHISNFLNRKRSLSIAGMDRILRVQHLSVLDLLDPDEVNRRATILPSSDTRFHSVPLVAGPLAAKSDRIRYVDAKDVLKVEGSFLNSLRAETMTDRRHWTRFVALRVEAREGMSMFPRLLPGATVLLDRHYNSFKPYRRNEANIYAVRVRGDCVIKYVEMAGKELLLRPHNQAYPVGVLQVEAGRKPADYLIGRVCYVGFET